MYVVTSPLPSVTLATRPRPSYVIVWSPSGAGWSMTSRCSGPSGRSTGPPGPAYVHVWSVRTPFGSVVKSMVPWGVYVTPDTPRCGVASVTLSRLPFAS